jgi:hypothetical protein
MFRHTFSNGAPHEPAQRRECADRDHFQVALLARRQPDLRERLRFFGKLAGARRVRDPVDQSAAVRFNQGHRNSSSD